MGIKGFNKFCKKYAPSAFFQGNIEDFQGLCVAIDATGWFYTAILAAVTNVVREVDIATEDPEPEKIRMVWHRILRSFMRSWLRAGVSPVFIFDGVPPEAKAKAREERKERRDKAASDLVDLRKKAMNDPLSWDGTIVKKISSAFVQSYRPKDKEIEELKSILVGMGISYFVAPGEAEELCSSLCGSGVVQAVYSKDTDTLVHGALVLITDIHEDGTYLGVRRDSLLAELGLSKEQFIDLCILAGCDYNKNIPGIGIGKSYRLVKNYGCIDALPKTYDVSCLNYEEARKIFRDKSPKELGWNYPVVSVKVSTMLDNRLPGWYEEFSSIYESMDLNREVEISTEEI